MSHLAASRSTTTTYSGLIDEQQPAGRDARASVQPWESDARDGCSLAQFGDRDVVPQVKV